MAMVSYAEIIVKDNCPGLNPGWQGGADLWRSTAGSAAARTIRKVFQPPDVLKMKRRPGSNKGAEHLSGKQSRNRLGCGTCPSKAKFVVGTSVKKTRPRHSDKG